MGDGLTTPSSGRRFAPQLSTGVEAVGKPDGHVTNIRNVDTKAREGKLDDSVENA